MATFPLSPSETIAEPPESQGAPSQPAISTRSLYYQSQSKRPVETYPFDQGYLDRLALGDHSTTEHFVHYFYKLLLAKLRAKLRTSSSAEDVAQETLYRVLRHVKEHGGIHSPEKLGAFVNRVSENVVLESLRQSGKFSQVPENAPEPVERALDAERNCISMERKQVILRELRKLSSNDQAILQKVFLLEQDKDAICAELKIDRNYLRVQVHRALGRFRKLLALAETPAAKKAMAH